ncbi:MAG: hypothetical protein M1833_006286 [Piccolia ochrophora]|nr:MAG: hypothetical protein M1833_006286 [Piccolia ochrophora]
MTPPRKVTDFFRPAPRWASKASEQDDRLEESITLARPPPVAQTKSADAGGSFRSSAPSDHPSAFHSQSNEGSQRTVKNGIVIIRSSSDEESSSDSSLDDLETLLAPRIREAGSDATRKQAAVKPCIPKGPRMHESLHDAPSSSLPHVPKYKFSLGSLVTNAERDKAYYTGFGKTKVTLNINSETGLDGSLGRSTENGNVNENLLASVVDGPEEPGGLQKVMRAMERTEAFSRNMVWYFFRHDIASGTAQARPFPEHVSSSQRWHARLKAADQRLDMFLSGFVQEMVERDRALPDDWILWMLDQYHQGKSWILREATPSNSQEQASSSQVENLLTPSKIDEIFQALGARPEALDGQDTIRPVPENIQAGPSYSPGRLLSTVDMFRRVAPDLSPNALDHVIALLSRLTLDITVIEDPGLLEAVQSALASLYGSVSDDAWDLTTERLGNAFYTTVDHHSLRLQLVNGIPISSPRLHAFRRRLALAFFFSDVSHLTRPASDTHLRLRSMARRLQTPDFKINDSTDIAKLATLVALLDTAVDDGASPAHVADKDVADKFNRDVDYLAKAVKALFAQIVDTGASHLSRTEAKEAVGRLQSRLVYSVRTRRAKRKNVFGDDGNRASGGAGSMAKFLTKSRGGGG